MQAAERLFTSRRFHEITMDDVAKEAGVGKGTIYRYFHDKDDLFFQTATAGFDELCNLLQRRCPPMRCFTDQLLIACRQIGKFFCRRQQLLRLMQNEEGRMAWCRGEMHERWAERRKKIVESLAQMIEKGVSEGAIREDIPAEVLANFLLGMLRTRGRDLGGAPPDMREHEIVVETVLPRGRETAGPASGIYQKGQLTMRRALAALVILGIVGAVGWRVYDKIYTAKGPAEKKGNVAVAVEVTKVRRATMHDIAQFSGDLMARSEFVVAPKVAGRLVKLLVDIGDTITNGQLIALLDDQEYAQQVEQAKAELEVSKAAVEEAQSNLDAARREFDRAEALRRRRSPARPRRTRPRPNSGPPRPARKSPCRWSPRRRRR